MGTAERRLELLKYLCRVRHATLGALGAHFGVSRRTIQRDIIEIELIFAIPLETRRGRYDGGVYVLGDYRFDRMYMSDEELALLQKASTLLEGTLSGKESDTLRRIIKNYAKAPSPLRA